MIEKMAELVRDKRIEGISDIRDESDRQGYRVVIELKRDAVADVMLNQLYRFTPLQTSFGANMVALNGGKPEVHDADRHAEGVRVLPRGGHQPPDEIPAAQGARAGPCPGRPGDSRRQYRRGDQADPAGAGPATAREQLMTRRWPAGDVESLILLIDDPRHRINDDGTYNLSEEQARAILELRLRG